jgi:hypothetical protein
MYLERRPEGRLFCFPSAFNATKAALPALQNVATS